MLYKIECPTFQLLADKSVELKKETAKDKSYLVGKPLTYCCSPTGRATKGYVALQVDKDSAGLVFLKDVWRPDSDQIHPELDTYMILNRKNVTNVPTVLGGGDVGGPSAQCTLTQECLSSNSPPLKRAHARLILKELGRPLDSYLHSAELMSIVIDAFGGKSVHNLPTHDVALCSSCSTLRGMGSSRDSPQRHQCQQYSH